jgi:hypothetical protein
MNRYLLETAVNAALDAANGAPGPIDELENIRCDELEWYGRWRLRLIVALRPLPGEVLHFDICPRESENERMISGMERGKPCR